MNEKTANKKHWHVFVRKKFFLRKKFPIIDDKSVIICQQVNNFYRNFATLCLKDRNLQSENLKLLSWVIKKIIKKNPTGRGGIYPPPTSPHPCTIGLKHSGLLKQRKFWYYENKMIKRIDFCMTSYWYWNKSGSSFQFCILLRISTSIWGKYTI